MNGLPTISFSPYGANSGPKMATQRDEHGDDQAGDQLWAGSRCGGGWPDCMTLMTRSPSSLAG